MADEGLVNEITIGIGELLAANGIGVWGGLFTSSDVAITYGPIPQEQPVAIGLTPYIPRRDRQLGTGVLAIQCYFRASDLVSLNALRGQVEDFLDGRRNVSAGGYVLPLIWWSSGADMGSDGSGSVTTAGGRRHEASDNYYMHFSQPER